MFEGCNIKTFGPLAIQNHYQRKHCTANIVIPVRRETKDDFNFATIDHSLNFECDVCKSLLLSEDMLTLHKQSQHLNVEFLSCPFCPYEENNEKGTMEDHIKENHLKIKRYRCLYNNNCNFKCQQLPSIKDHLEKIHYGKICQNDENGQKSNRIRLFDACIEEIFPDGSHSCKLCHEPFFSRILLNIHESYAHTASKPSILQCITCNYKGKSISAINRHVSIAHEHSKRFKCKLCKDFTSGFRLGVVNHIQKYHTQIKGVPSRVNVAISSGKRNRPTAKKVKTGNGISRYKILRPYPQCELNCAQNIIVLREAMEISQIFRNIVGRAEPQMTSNNESETRDQKGNQTITNSYSLDENCKSMLLDQNSPLGDLGNTIIDYSKTKEVVKNMAKDIVSDLINNTLCSNSNNEDKSEINTLRQLIRQGIESTTPSQNIFHDEQRNTSYSIKNMHETTNSFALNVVKSVLDPIVCEVVNSCAPPITRNILHDSSTYPPKSNSILNNEACKVDREKIVFSAQFIVPWTCLLELEPALHSYFPERNL
jgi:hypothetical protein